jgi:hypothetical protein
MLSALKKLVIAQKTAVLPGEAPAPELEALHEAIIRYDRLVSMAVIQAIQGAAFDFPRDQVRALRSELDQLFASTTGGREVDNYRKYRQRLDQMSDLTEQAASKPTEKESK